MQSATPTCNLESDLTLSYGRLKDQGSTRRASLPYPSLINEAIPEVNRDLHQIPTRLRAVLETCLGEDPCPAALEMYQPRIRQQLYELLQGLKGKQGAWRSAVAAGL